MHITEFLPCLLETQLQQSGCELDLHAHSVRNEESAACCGGHLDCAGDHRVDDRRHLAAIPLGRCRSSAVFDLGSDGDRAATVDHGDELGKVNSLQLATWLELTAVPSASFRQTPVIALRHRAGRQR